jgi:septum formation protein
MLLKANLNVSIRPARIDEDEVQTSLCGEGASPRDLSDALAEWKASHVSRQIPASLVVGCDQVLDCEGRVFTKPENPEDAFSQLDALRGRTHTLWSAVVVCEDGKPIWRHVGEVRMTMRDLSDRYLHDYLARNWKSIQNAVGCYKLEEEGVRLFSRIDGDYFTVLGLPLIELLTWLGIRGDIET